MIITILIIILQASAKPKVDASFNQILSLWLVVTEAAKAGLVSDSLTI